MSDVLVKGAVRPDLTRIKDPAEIWPDPLDCPDWPLSSGSAIRDGAMTREHAAARLAAVETQLNPDGAELRKPNEADVEHVMTAHFRALNPGEGGGSSQRAAALGFEGWRPITVAGNRILEAIHLRGFLRKMDAAAEAEVADAAATEAEAHRRKLARYETERQSGLAELEALAEAEARHLQHLADKAAWARSEDIRRALRIKHSTARKAAWALGEPEPSLPDLGGTV